MPTTGKMELAIKINEMPADVQTVENGWKQFDLDGDSPLVTIKVKPKVFKNLSRHKQITPCGSRRSPGRWAN